MLNPSLSILVLAVAVTAVLFAANWYVWGLTYASDFRMPSRMTPLSPEELLIDLAVGPVVATKRASAAHSNEGVDGGFKHVA
ncbi:MAG: hypothetical protein ACREQT_03480 [Candidatus Binataceae bacterium]